MIVRTATTTGTTPVSAMCGLGEVAVAGGTSISNTNKDVRSSGPAISTVAFAVAGQIPLGWRGNSNGGSGDVTTVYAVCAPAT